MVGVVLQVNQAEKENEDLSNVTDFTRSEVRNETNNDDLFAQRLDRYKTKETEEDLLSENAGAFSTSSSSPQESFRGHVDAQVITTNSVLAKY